MLFTGEYIESPLVIFTREFSDYIDGLEGLSGKTVVIQDGYGIHEWVQDKYPKLYLRMLKGTDSTQRAIQALAVGAIDAYIGNLATVSYHIKSLNLDNIKIATPTPFCKDVNAMAVRYDWPELVSIINK